MLNLMTLAMSGLIAVFWRYHLGKPWHCTQAYSYK